MNTRTHEIIREYIDVLIGSLPGKVPRAIWTFAIRLMI